MINRKGIVLLLCSVMLLATVYLMNTFRRDLPAKIMSFHFNRQQLNEERMRDLIAKFSVGDYILAPIHQRYQVVKVEDFVYLQKALKFLGHDAKAEYLEEQLTLDSKSPTYFHRTPYILASYQGTFDDIDSAILFVSRLTVEQKTNGIHTLAAEDSEHLQGCLVMVPVAEIKK